MEFMAGGDLMNLLIKRGVSTETETKLIIAETCLAVHHVYLINFMHGDIKRENLLLSSSGIFS
jgi:serine/threonine protein kinase